MNYFRETKLSPKAAELVQFDVDSIKQVVAAERLTMPDVWLADPDEYERNGRIRRDSESPRLLAYSKKTRTLYGTDGCNSCARRVPAELTALEEDDLIAFARDNELRMDLLKRLIALIGLS